MIDDLAELAWVAGLLEGEGSFSVKRRGLVIHCNMTDQDVLLRLQSIVGGFVTGPHPPRALGSKPMFYWNLSSRGVVVELIRLLRPWMCKRRAQAIDRMLEWHLAHPLFRQRKDAAQHGTIGMYSNHGCRCQLCKNVWNARQRERRRSNPEQWRAYQERYRASKRRAEQDVAA